MTKEKRKFKISANMVLNIFVGAFTLYLIYYFCTSEDGLIDLFSTPDSFIPLWLIIAVVVYDFNIIIDSVVTLLFIRTQFPHFKFIDAMKVAFVGVFFSAVTPSSTGGQPMQLYLFSKMNVSVGFSSACMTQKFLIYQIVTALYSVFSIILRPQYFESAFTNFWSTAFVFMGLAFQLSVMAGFVVLSFCKRITSKILQFVDWIMHKMKFIKNPDKKIASIRQEVEGFHKYNKIIMKNKKLLIASYILIFFQVLCVMAAPYFIYISFGMPEIASANRQPVGSFFDFVCIQSFVVFTSNLVPLPGASGGAELAFTMYFSQFFIVGAVNKIKPAILLWRFSSYYGPLIITAPFSYLTKNKKGEDERKKIIEEQVLINDEESVAEVTAENFAQDTNI